MQRELEEIAVKRPARYLGNIRIFAIFSLTATTRNNDFELSLTNTLSRGLKFNASANDYFEATSVCQLRSTRERNKVVTRSSGP